ncbi:hypothetical protein [Halomonas sp.]|uniref:hypothetical protein n=1 Tax=Halomonas sp. TaxID=1486246 RepID=UPI003D0CF7B5
MKLTLRSCRTFSFPDGTLRDGVESLAVWWYGPVRKNRLDNAVPTVEVFFRPLYASGDLGDVFTRQVALTHLGKLSIGSVWRKGVCKERIAYEESVFEVCFSEGGWQIVTLDDLKKSSANLEMEADILRYFSKEGPHKSYIIDFFLPGGRHLLVPCVEFFCRCYGLSSEVKRILATYPWEKVKERLFKPLDEPPEPGTWPVKLSWKMCKGDAILLAHILYDPYAEHAAKNVYAHIEKDFFAGHAYSFLQAKPWFQGEGKLSVAGIPLGSKAFLALRVLGSTQPDGTTILREKEQRLPTGGGKEIDEAGRPPYQRMPGAADIIDLTDDEEPDHGSSWLDIPDEEFHALGKPRKVVDKRRDRECASGARNAYSTGGETKFSTGEAYGSGKDVGYAHLHASLVMESQGMLRDMWEAFCYLHSSYPNRIQDVEWFTFENGFCDDPEPKLIRFNAVENDASIPSSVEQWPYVDYEKRRPRGVLVIRITSDSKCIYIVEIQRKNKTKSDESNFNEEEPISGLCFVLDDDAGFEQWLNKLLSEIRYKKGIFKKVLGRCPGHAEIFAHRKSKDDTVFCESAAKNAIRKMGLKL